MITVLSRKRPVIPSGFLAVAVQNSETSNVSQRVMCSLYYIVCLIAGVRPDALS